jgi:putative two-component system response regulator
MPESTAKVKKIIMAVDDMPVNLAVISNILCNDYDVRPVKSARAALALMNTVKPDLILLDIEMPEMSGLDFFNVIRTDPERPEHRNIPVIFVSAHGAESIRNRAMAGGALDYMVKPVDPATLLKKIDLLLNAEHVSGQH